MNFGFGFGAEIGKKFSCGLVWFSAGRASASFGRECQLSVSFGADRNWAHVASISSSELHFIAVSAQCTVIYAGFMTLTELFERSLFCYTV